MDTLKKSPITSRECANCTVTGVSLRACSRCKLVFYCGQDCQLQHWKAKTGHKEFCVAVDQRKPAAMGAAAKMEAEGDECAICLSSLSSSPACTLPCSHVFHMKCIEGLRALCLSQVCPMCRSDLPEAAEKLVDEKCRKYISNKRQVVINFFKYWLR